MIGAILRIRYELTQELDEGPIFHVFKARDRVMGKDVCVRTLQAPFSTEASYITRLKEIVGRVSNVRHENVERAYDLDDHEGSPFLVSDFSIGQPLSERIKKLAPFSVPVAVSTAISVVQGLEAFHHENIVHGDISARNIVVGTDGVPKLQLGGLWEAYSASRTAGSVALPQMAPYLAPEISSGAMPAPTSDLYAAGVLIYELLTGRTPFSGDTAVAVAMKHATAPMPSLRTINASVPLVLEEIVKKAMSKDPSKRYQAAAAMLADLRALQDALRFGKQISWPIQAAASTAEPQPVAPRMNAVRPEQKQTKPTEERSRSAPSRDRQEAPGDLPPWLMWMVYVGIGVFVIVIGGWMFFNVNKKKLLKVPNVVGLSANEATLRLSDLGLKLRVAKKIANEKYPEGTVIETNPPTGEEARSYVAVVLSSGSKFVEVPDLKGRTLDDAKSLLQNIGLDASDEIRRVRDGNIEAGIIISQVPEARSKVERGTKVRMKVSSGDSRGGDSEDLAAETQSAYTVKIKMPPGDAPVSVRVDMTDAKGTSTVYEEERQPGDDFTVSADGFGESVIFRIFFDGDLVSQKQAEAVKPDAPSLDRPEPAAGTRRRRIR